MVVEQFVERRLARVPERRMAGVVAKPDRLGQVLVQLQRTGHDACNPGRLQRVGHARAVVVAGRIDEDLRLAFQTPKRLRVQDAIAVALERGADTALVLFVRPSGGLVGADGERRERSLLLLADARSEGVGNSACNVWHEATLDDDGDSPAVDRPGRARHIRGPRGQEEHDHIRDLAGLAKASERPAGSDLREHPRRDHPAARQVRPRRATHPSRSVPG